MPTELMRPPSPPTAFAEPWLGPWRFAAAMTWGGLASFAQLCDTSQQRTFWSTNLSSIADRYLRSPELLALAARNLEAMTTLTRLCSQLHRR